MPLVASRRLLFGFLCVTTTLSPLCSHAFESRMESNMWYLIALVRAGCDRVFNPDSRARISACFMDKYAPLLAQWHGDGYAFVAVQPSPRSADGRTCVFTCQDIAAGVPVHTQVEFQYIAGDLLESLTFDRHLTLPDGMRIRPGAPVPIETLMRALRLTTRAVAADPGDGLVVKKLAEKTSLKKPGADGLKSVQKIRGDAPTAHTDFDSVNRVTIGAFDPADSNRAFHTFNCHPDGIAGHNSDRYSTVFMLEPDLGLTRPVARFNARIRKGRVKFVYKAWFPNPQEVLVDQASYDATRMLLKTNRPAAVVSFSGVLFAMDGDSNVVDDVPMLIKLKKTGARARSVRLLNPPE
jgi:hypothetical protein